MDTRFEANSGFEHSGGDVVDTPAHLSVEREVIGANVGANGYTTLDQAGELGRLLHLRREDRLLDIGAGRGWPGLYLAEQSGCEATLLEISDTDLRQSLGRAERANVSAHCSFVRGTATAPPFRSKSFDVLIHADVL
jgi:2-polyprenyl-3-methyl-5-hydroxy-6-metoxy-1,4-benzoquinol methylase